MEKIFLTVFIVLQVLFSCKNDPAPAVILTPAKKNEYLKLSQIKTNVIFTI
jgi:hypothetical protein